MSKDTTKQTYIVKIEKETGDAILFFPDDLNMRGAGFKIGCYAIVGSIARHTRII